MIITDRFELILFAVHCLMSRTANQLFTGGSARFRPGVEEFRKWDSKTEFVHHEMTLCAYWDVKIE